MISGVRASLSMNHSRVRRSREVVENDAAAFAAVAPGAARFLIVAFQAVRAGAVDDEAHVGLVNAHAEGVGGDQRVQVAVEPALLHLVALGGVEAGVVQARPFCRRRRGRGRRLLRSPHTACGWRRRSGRCRPGRRVWAGRGPGGLRAPLRSCSGRRRSAGWAG